MPSTIFMWSRRKRVPYTSRYGRLTPSKVLDEVCSIFKADYAKVVGRSRKRELVQIRSVYIYFCRKLGFSFTETGLWIGRGHCDVQYLNNKIKAFIERGKPWSNKDYQIMVGRAREVLNAKYNLSL